jgi:light-regulated signal transduction histidine kinase (bacteriophytochrome)
MPDFIQEFGSLVVLAIDHDQIAAASLQLANRLGVAQTNSSLYRQGTKDAIHYVE